jgi:hypothetical protein
VNDTLLVDRLVRQMVAVPGLKILVRPAGRDGVMIESVREKELMTVPQIARLAGVSIATVRRRWVDTGLLRPVVGRRYARADVMRLLDVRRQGAGVVR